VNKSSPYESPEHFSEITEDERYHPKLLSTQGRIGRLRYFGYTMVFNLVCGFLVGIIVAVLAQILGPGKPGEGNPTLMGIVLLLYFPMIVYMFIAMKRRLNDLNHTGWLSFLMLVPLINLFFVFYLLLFSGTEGSNNYGLKPVNNSKKLIVFGVLIPVLFMGGLGIFAAVAIPAYNDFVERAKAEIASQALGQ